MSKQTMDSLLSFQIHGGADHGNGLLDTLLALLTFIEGLTTQEPSGAFAALLPGIVSLNNIHPLLVHFPITLLLLFFITDLIGTLFKKYEWREYASRLLYLGTGFALLTVLAGLSAADSVPHLDDVHDIMERHEAFGFWILGIASLLSVWRIILKPYPLHPSNPFFLLLAGLLCIIISLGADLGGLMVYKYGVGVAAVKVEANNHHTEHTQ